MTRSRSFVIVLGELMGRWLVVCGGGLSGLMGIQGAAIFQTCGVGPGFGDMVKARAKAL